MPVAETDRNTVVYFIETTDGVHRAMIPADWSAKWRQERDYSSLVFSDSEEKDRLVFNNVLSFRDSAVPIQTMTATPDGNGGASSIEWDDITENSPLSTYAMERVLERQTREANRRRRNNQNAAFRIEEDIPFDQ